MGSVIRLFIARLLQPPRPCRSIDRHIVVLRPLEFFPHVLFWLAAEFCGIVNSIIHGLGDPCALRKVQIGKLRSIVRRPPYPHNVVAAAHARSGRSDAADIDANHLLRGIICIRIAGCQRRIHKLLDGKIDLQGLRELSGRGGTAASALEPDREGEGARAAAPGDPWDEPQPDQLAEEFAEIDAVLSRSSRLLAGEAVPPRTALQGDERLGILYDLDWDEDTRLAEWRQVLERTADLPAVLRAALALDAWHDIEVLQRGDWVGGVLVAAFLRQEGVTAHHLACLHVGAQKIPRERRRSTGRTERVVAHLDAMREAAVAGWKEHDRLLLAKERLERILRGRRASSKLPALLNLILARPVVSTGMVQAALKVSRQGALDLIGVFGLRELTGRGSYRAWGIV